MSPSSETELFEELLVCAWNPPKDHTKHTILLIRTEGAMTLLFCQLSSHEGVRYFFSSKESTALHHLTFLYRLWSSYLYHNVQECKRIWLYCDLYIFMNTAMVSVVILYCLRFVFIIISVRGNKALMLSIYLLIEWYFKMPMFNLFSEVNILNASTIKKNRVGAYIIYHYSLQIFCIDFAFCQNTRNYKQSDFRKKKKIFFPYL